jgi:hypothetical protein
MMEVTHQNGAKVMEAAKETVFPYCLGFWREMPVTA